MKLSDKNFRKIFFGLATFALVLILGLSFSWVDFSFNTSLTPRDIWMVSLAMFIIINIAYDFNQLKIKIASVFLMTGVFGLIFNLLLDLNLGPVFYLFFLFLLVLVISTSHFVD